ncbi:MAG: OprO/OprP family phosphate-selective porin [Thermoanaerobaculia bacterium]|nr:OprO/OprP family phosphate-selective porin [Thermoanaerobaculia bacterium]
MRITVTISAALLALGLAAGPAWSQTPSDVDQRIQELEKKVAELTKEKEAPMATLASGAETERASAPVALAGFYDNGYLVFTSKDGAFKYWLDGRINLDAATYSGAENRLADGAEVRRARIGIKATLFEDWLAELDLDFADNEVEIKDLWVGYAGFDDSLIKLGNHKAPFGLENLTSSKYITFIERGYIDAWVPDRRLGLNYSRWGERWQASAGLYGQAAGSFNDKDSLGGGGAGTDQELGLVGRFTFAPILEKDRVLHLGLAATHMKPDVGEITTDSEDEDILDRVDAARVLKLDSRAETHVLRAKFLSTGDMKYVESWDQIGGELAAVYGPVSFQAEYQRTDVNRISTPVADYRDHSFDGYYAFVSWMVTGEHRPYSVSEGEFGRIIPKRKAGAFELALRYSTLDLNDITTVDPITGGAAENITLGANWYINANHKIMLNVTQVDHDEYAKPGKDWAPIPAGDKTKLTPIKGDDFTIIAMRYQLAF